MQFSLMLKLEDSLVERMRERLSALGEKELEPQIVLA